MHDRLRLGELCAGYGGLGLALELLGIDHELTWYAENDDDAATVMAAHTDAPNLGDLTTITDCPPVDIVTAGFPCQPVSTAGARQGVNDARWLIRDVVAVWQRSGARWLVLENVPGLRSANDGEAFGQVIDALVEVGATAEWTHLRASDVGACHRRERWFCLATTDTNATRRTRSLRPSRRVGEVDRPSDSSGATPDTDSRQPERWRVGRVVAGATRLPRQSDRSGADEIRSAAGGGRPTDAHADGRGRPVERSGRLRNRSCGRDVDGCDRARFGGYAEAVHRWELITGRPAPDPTTDGRLSAVFVEWMQGLQLGWVTDHVPRRRALSILGNGVVPQQAAAALADLQEVA